MNFSFTSTPLFKTAYFGTQTEENEKPDSTSQEEEEEEQETRYTIKGDIYDISANLPLGTTSEHSGSNFIEVLSKEPLATLKRLFGSSNVKKGWKKHQSTRKESRHGKISRRSTKK